MLAGASDTIDPIDAARDDIAGSKDLIASAVEDLTQHQRWIENYRVAETRHARRVRRQELMLAVELTTKRILRALRRFALLVALNARAIWRFTVSMSVTVARAVTAASIYAYGLARSAAAWTAPRVPRSRRRHWPPDRSRLCLDIQSDSSACACNGPDTRCRFRMDARSKPGAVARHAGRRCVRLRLGRTRSSARSIAQRRRVSPGSVPRAVRLRSPRNARPLRASIGWRRRPVLSRRRLTKPRRPVSPGPQRRLIP